MSDSATLTSSPDGLKPSGGDERLDEEPLVINMASPSKRDALVHLASPFPAPLRRSL